MQIGDFGRQGEYNQSHVARMLAIKAADDKPDFIISVGDNMYPSKCPMQHAAPCMYA